MSLNQNRALMKCLNIINRISNEMYVTSYTILVEMILKKDIPDYAIKHIETILNWWYMSKEDHVDFLMIAQEKLSKDIQTKINRRMLEKKWYWSYIWISEN